MEPDVNVVAFVVAFGASKVMDKSIPRWSVKLSVPRCYSNGDMIGHAKSVGAVLEVGGHLRNVPGITVDVTSHTWNVSTSVTGRAWRGWCSYALRGGSLRVARIVLPPAPEGPAQRSQRREAHGVSRKAAATVESEAVEGSVERPSPWLVGTRGTWAIAWGER